MKFRRPETLKAYIKKSKEINSLGVFAKTDIKRGRLVETVPLIILPIKELRDIQKTHLNFYYFEYSHKYFCIMLGFGSLYNHSYTPNAKYIYDYKNKLVKIISLKEIGKDEEILINYNYYSDSKTPLESWFDPTFKDKLK